MLVAKLRLLLLLIAATSAASAAEPGGTITLPEALARTLRGSPELAACQWDLRAAEARLLQAGVKPNPELNFELENPTGSGRLRSGDESEHTLTLSQLIELGGKRPARLREAEAGRSVVEWEYQVKRVEALKNTTLAYLEALAAQQQLALAEEIVQVSGEAVRLAEQRAGVGQGSAVEAVRAKVAVSSAKIEREQAARSAAAARGQLAAQWGARAADFSAVQGDLEARSAGSTLETLRRRLLGHPDLARWTAEREKRVATLAREETRARPDLTVSAGPRMIGWGGEATFVAGISIPLPMHDRNQGSIAEARARLARLDEEKRAAESRAFAALNAAYQQWKAAESEITLLQESVLPGAQEAEKLISEGYAAGRFTQFEVLEARRTLHTARGQWLRALADFQKARAELDALTAQPIDLPRRSGAPPKATPPAAAKASAKTTGPSRRR